MPSIVAVDKTPYVPAVPEKVKGATLKLTSQDIAYLVTAMEYAYKAHRKGQAGVYVSTQVGDLYKTLKAAGNGKTAVSADRPTLTMQDLVGFRTF